MSRFRATESPLVETFGGEPLENGGWRIAAPAKVNLFLELLRKRPDGYHELETLIVLVELADTLEFLPRPDGLLQLDCNEPTIPTGPTNLVWKAAELLRNRFGVTLGATIRLTKRIPHEAGLGGGSSDAASTLVALNSLWELHRPLAELRELSAELGSDVAAFLTPPACWCTGRGEVTSPVELGAVLHLVLVKPPVGLSTAAVYKNCTIPEQPRSGTALRDALASGDLPGICAEMHNRLQFPAFDLQPSVKAVYDALTATQPAGVMVSGSGSCVFAVARDATDADRIAREVVIPPSWVYATRTRAPEQPPTRR